MNDRMNYETHFFSEHFKILPLRERSNLFKQAVRSVEIEISSYCNRACWFCPNATYSRKEKKYMSDLVYSSIIEALATIDYDGVISYSGYTEASHSRKFIDRICHARSVLPKSYIFTCSNGDFLTPEYLDELAHAGMDQMFISCYIDDKSKGSFSLIRALTAMSRLQKRLDLKMQYTVADPVSVCAEVINKHNRLTISCRDHSVFANDRGGLVHLTRPERVEPCGWVFTNVYIDYDGTMKPCANVRADVPLHSRFMYGKITNRNSIFDIYGNEIATKWRRNLVTFGKKSAPCKYCTQGIIPDTEENRTFSTQAFQNWVAS